MKNASFFSLALYCLSLPIAYLGVWMSADWLAAVKNVPYDVPFIRVALSALVLFLVAVVFSQIIKDRVSSLLRVISVGIITPIAGYLVLMGCETLLWAPSYPGPTSDIFFIRLFVYSTRFMMATICACLIALILGRSMRRDQRQTTTRSAFS